MFTSPASLGAGFFWGQPGAVWRKRGPPHDYPNVVAVASISTPRRTGAQNLPALLACRDVLEFATVEGALHGPRT